MIALALFIAGASSLDSMAYYYQPGTYASGAVLVLAATALVIASFIMLRTRPVANVNSSDRPSTSPQQPPLVFIVGGQPQPPTGQVQPLPADVVPIGHPLSLPREDTANTEEGKQPPPAVIPIDQPAVAVDGTVVRPREQPMHTTSTTIQPQAPRTQVHMLQPQSQHPVQLQHQTGQLQYIMQPQPQHTVQPHVPLVPLPLGNKPEKQQTGIGKKMFETVAEAGAELFAESLLSDNTDPLAMVGDAVISMEAGTTGGDTKATGSGDASC
jgi:hypothetical protein